jgi:hypothetical protein
MQNSFSQPNSNRSFDLGKFYEMLVVAGLTIPIFVFGFDINSLLAALIAVVLVGLAILMYNLAVRHALKSAKEFIPPTYKLTRNRLLVLKNSGMPKEICAALEKVKDHSPQEESDFLECIAIESDLGFAYIRRHKTKLLRYTLYEKPSTEKQVEELPADHD